MKQINTYGYMVVIVNRTPIFVVQVAHEYLAGFYMFSDSETAQKHIDNLKAKLSQFASLSYDPNFKFSQTCISALLNPNYLMYSKVSDKQVYIHA